jgi:hypothetical protein
MLDELVDVTDESIDRLVFECSHIISKLRSKLHKFEAIDVDWRDRSGT